MDLWLYTTATPNNYVNKILSNDTKLTFYTKNQNTDIMNPTIILNGDVAGFCGFNYAYIPRYNSALINRSQSHFNKHLIDERQKQEAHTGVVLKKWEYTFHPDRSALVGICGGGVFN